MFKLFTKTLLGLITACLCSSVIAQQMPTPSVSVQEAIEVQSMESRHYTGLLLSPAKVDLVARVSGELLEIGFSDGDMVKAGQQLYRLDDIRYGAAVKGAQAAIAKCKASLQYTESNFKRIDGLYRKNVTTLDAMEAARMSYHADQASLLSAEAALTTANDDLKNTKIVAPISGKIGLTNYTKGNYLTPASGTLATIVQMDPIRLSFSISTRDFLLNYGSEKAFKENALVKIKLANGQVYPAVGTYEFRNNQANRSTDTIQFYISFPNPDLVLLPNNSVTVMLQKKNAGKYPAVMPSALLSDAKSSYVYVLDANNVATRRDVELGSMSGSDLQLIKSGLKAGERVVVQGTHKVVPGQPVNVVPVSK